MKCGFPYTFAGSFILVWESLQQQRKPSVLVVAAGYLAAAASSCWRC